MATYIIFTRESEIVDPEAMKAYQVGGRKVPPVAGMKPLVYYGDFEVLEGASADGVVVLEFPDEETARQWYFSPEYQEMVKVRQQAAPYRAIMVKGV